MHTPMYVFKFQQVSILFSISFFEEWAKIQWCETLTPLLDVFI